MYLLIKEIIVNIMYYDWLINGQQIIAYNIRINRKIYVFLLKSIFKI